MPSKLKHLGHLKIFQTATRVVIFLVHVQLVSELLSTLNKGAPLISPSLMSSLHIGKEQTEGYHLNEIL